MNDLFLSSTGRTNRKAFIYSFLMCGVAFSLIQIVSNLLSHILHSYIIIALNITSAFCCAYVTFNIHVKRLHDLNKDWTLMAYDLMFFVLAYALADINESLAYVLLMLSVALYAYIWVATMFFKGDTGPNKYGNDPLRTVDQNSYNIGVAIILTIIIGIALDSVPIDESTNQLIDQITSRSK